MARVRKLAEYRRKRRFSRTTEPPPRVRPAAKRARPAVAGKPLVFVIQEHHATRLHFDLRLEHEGVLKSWAVTREPLNDPSERRLAIETEDHPLEYGGFHGVIPRGEYGAGVVKIWDRGTFESEKPLSDSLDRGLLEIVLHGKKLKGRYVLVRIRSEGPKSQWLFFKRKPKVVGLKVRAA